MNVLAKTMRTFSTKQAHYFVDAMEQFELDRRNHEKRTNFSLFEHFARTIPIPIVQKFDAIIEEKIAEFTLTKNEQLFELYLSNPAKADANQMDTKIVFFSAPIIKTLLAKKFAEKLKYDLTKSIEDTQKEDGKQSKLPNAAIDFIFSKSSKNASKRNSEKLTNSDFCALSRNQQISIQSIVDGVNFNDVHVEMADCAENNIEELGQKKLFTKRIIGRTDFVNQLVNIAKRQKIGVKVKNGSHEEVRKLGKVSQKIMDKIESSEPIKDTAKNFESIKTTKIVGQKANGRSKLMAIKQKGKFADYSEESIKSSFNQLITGLGSSRTLLHSIGFILQDIQKNSLIDFEQ